MPKEKPKSKTSLKISENLISDMIVKELINLFHKSPPSYLKKSINTLFFSYLCNTEPGDYDPKIKEISTDIWYLLKFLEKAEMENRKIN